MNINALISSILVVVDISYSLNFYHINFELESAHAAMKIENESHQYRARPAHPMNISFVISSSLVVVDLSYSLNSYHMIR